MADSRETALQLLQNILENKSFSGLPKGSPTHGNDDDKAFITMLLLTSLRRLSYIRKILKTLVTKKLSQQNIVGQCALILGTTELLYMQTPDYAVINSYVNIAKNKADRYVAGFVNAVLRKISRSEQEFIEKDTGEFFPQSFRALLKRSYSSKIIAAIEKSALSEPMLDITCIDEDSAAKLNGRRLPLGSIRLASKGKISLLPDYNKGSWWVQDFSSALAVKMLDSLKGKKVLELCAAPGGKTAQLLSSGAETTCLDISSERLKILKENLDRLNLHPKKIICGDGLDFLKSAKEKYDIIVLDAPCSATGTLRRHPEIVHLKTQADIDKQAALQKQFLEQTPQVMQKGGILLYCTCSLCKEEGEEQIRSFVAAHPEFKIINLKPKIPPELSQIVTDEGFIRVLPHHLAEYGGADGFFIARLQKAA